MQVAVDREVQPRPTEAHLAADVLDGAARRAEGALLEDVLGVAVRCGLVDADSSLGRRIRLVRESASEYCTA